MYNNNNQSKLTLIPELEQMFEDASSGYQRSFRGANQNYEVGTGGGGNIAPAQRPKSIWLHNTDLDAPYVGGNFDFLYNGGAPEAKITFNTHLSPTRSFAQGDLDALKIDLESAGTIWSEKAELQVSDINGNFNHRIKLLFSVKVFPHSRNSNKRTQVHPTGNKSIPFPFNIGIQKDRETVVRDLNIFIKSKKKVLVHELGHVFGLRDEYEDGWFNMKFSVGHVGPNSPFVKDKIAIMNEGYLDRYGDNGEFRTRYFIHFGRAILKSFMGVPNFTMLTKHNGKVVSKTLIGRIALLKKNIAGDPPYNSDQPNNPQFSVIKIVQR